MKILRSEKNVLFFQSHFFTFWRCTLGYWPHGQCIMYGNNSLAYHWWKNRHPRSPWRRTRDRFLYSCETRLLCSFNSYCCCRYTWTKVRTLSKSSSCTLHRNKLCSVYLKHIHNWVINKLNSFSTAYFSGVVKVLYNLLYHQVILQVSCKFSRAERNMILKKRHNRATTHLETILAETIEYFSKSGLYGTDEPSTSASPTYARVKMHCIEQQVHSINIIQLLSKCILLKLFFNFVK